MIAELDIPILPSESVSPETSSSPVIEAATPAASRPSETQTRAAEWATIFGPRNSFEAWLVGQLAWNSVRIDMAARMTDALQASRSRRVEHRWDEEHDLQAERLFERLPIQPALVVLQLRQTLHGVNLLVDRWNGLIRALDARGTWDDDQRRLAFDLLGVPVELRSVEPRLPEGADAATLRATAEAEIAALDALKTNHLIKRNDREYRDALFGRSLDASPEAREVRRIVAASERSLRWALNTLKDFQRRPAYAQRTEPIAKPRPSTVAAPSPPTPPPSKPEPPPRPAPSEPLSLSLESILEESSDRPSQPALSIRPSTLASSLALTIARSTPNLKSRRSRRRRR